MRKTYAPTVPQTRFWTALTPAGDHQPGFFAHSGPRIKPTTAHQSLFQTRTSYDTTVKLWDAGTGFLLHTLQGHHSGVWSVAFAPSGNQLASGSVDKTVKLWDTDSGKLLRTLEGHSDVVEAIVFSADGQLLASKSGDGTIRIWCCKTWETVVTIPAPTDSSWNPALAFHPTLPRLVASGLAIRKPATGKQSRMIYIWDLDLNVVVCRRQNASNLAASLNGMIRTTGNASQDDGHYRNAKVLLIGNTSVGKSGLGLVLAGRKFRATESTHGRHIWTIDEEKWKPDSSSAKRSHQPGYVETRETLLWDLAGQPGYRLVHQLHLGEVAVALVLFDNRSETEPFAGVSYWARALDAAA